MKPGQTKIGIHTYGYPPEQLLALACTAERLGFEGLWIGEHYMIPQSFSSKHPLVHNDAERKEDAILASTIRIDDPWFVLGMIASATTRLKIGTAVCVAPLMHPLLLARAAATAQSASQGRFHLGIGAGWLEEEYAAIGIPFKERGTRLDEAVDILRAAWAGSYFSHSGKHFNFEEIQITPERVDVPLVCGGNTGPALRRVVRVADAWINSGTITLEDACTLRDEIEKLRRASEKTSDLIYYVRPNKTTYSEVENFRSEGFNDIVLWGPHVWPKSPEISLDEKITALERVAVELGIKPE